MDKLTRLFEPTAIGQMELRNRIVMPPMGTRFGTDTGGVTDRQIAYYAERAKGGAGLIMVEATCVEGELGKLGPTQLRIDGDRYVADLNELAEAIQACGPKAAIQLHHAGRQAHVGGLEGKQPVSASEVFSPSRETKARALSVDEIDKLVENFADAARRAKAAGFDALEIHGAHGYLIAQFLSPYVNRRQDEYGGDLEGRMKFALEIIERVRSRVGSDFPILFRISGDEYIEGGLRIDETRLIAGKLEKAGVDAIHVTAGIGERAWWSTQPMLLARGCLVHLAEAIKKNVTIPVITVGRINDPTLAEKIIEEGRADLVSMGRALIADPELPRKAIEGRFSEIRKCIGCNRGCIDRIHDGLHVRCAVNAAVGREREFRLEQAEKSKKVTVIGGGPAGMEAARIAAMRGHDVTLYERSQKLGGQLHLAAAAPGKEEVRNLIDYLTNQVNQLGVRLELGGEITRQVMNEIRADAVIIATGADPLVPKIPGINLLHVINAWDVLAARAEVGDEVAIAGGGMVGCETAEFLIEKGKSVTIVEMLDQIAVDMERYTRMLTLERLNAKGAVLLTNTKVERIVEDGLQVVNNGTIRTIRAQSVVLALGSRPNDSLFADLRGHVKELYLIGDCRKPRKIYEAVYEGSLIARKI